MIRLLSRKVTIKCNCQICPQEVLKEIIYTWIFRTRSCIVIWFPSCLRWETKWGYLLTGNGLEITSFLGSCLFSFRERWDEKEGLKRERERPMGGREGGRLWKAIKKEKGTWEGTMLLGYVEWICTCTWW